MQLRKKFLSFTLLGFVIILLSGCLTEPPTALPPIPDTNDLDEIELIPLESTPVATLPDALPPVDDVPPTPLPENAFWSVYFTDPININAPSDLYVSIEDLLIFYIDAAQFTIHIAAFEFDLERVADALIAAQERGVTVRWMADDENGIEADEEDENDLFPKMADAGIRVKSDERTALMHNKFIIFDNYTVWTGSMNLTRNGVYRNNNNVIIMSDPTVAAIYEQEFLELWSGEHGPTSPSQAKTQEAFVDGTYMRVLFGAEDEVVSWLTPILMNATNSIRFMTFSFTHDALGDAMLLASNNGASVAGVFETRASETEYSELGVLYCAGLPVRQDGNPGTMHHKVIIIDDEIVITGSFNFSESADDSNDENLLIIRNPDIAAQYLNEFALVWNEGKDVEPGTFDCTP